MNKQLVNLKDIMNSEEIKKVLEDNCPVLVKYEEHLVSLYTEHPYLPNLFRAEFLFVNGYGAIVLRHNHSMGGPDGLFEVSVQKNGAPCYTTHVTRDVLVCCDGDEVEEAMQAIMDL